jgi:uncharacterized protein (DUF2235 family)
MLDPYRGRLQNSNVVQFLAMLKKDDPTEQLVYYQVISLRLRTIIPSYCFRQAGIGTYTGNNVLGTPIIQGTSQLLDQMVAWNLPAHIKGFPSPFRLPHRV